MQRTCAFDVPPPVPLEELLLDEDELELAMLDDVLVEWVPALVLETEELEETDAPPSPPAPEALLDEDELSLPPEAVVVSRK